MTTPPPDRLPPRYPDEKWRVSWDWSSALGNDTISGNPTASPLGTADFTVDQVSTTGKITTLMVSGGSEDPDARIALLCMTAGGEGLGFNIPAPIRSR